MNMDTVRTLAERYAELSKRDDRADKRELQNICNMARAFSLTQMAYFCQQVVSYYADVHLASMTLTVFTNRFSRGDENETHEIMARDQFGIGEFIKGNDGVLVADISTLGIPGPTSTICIEGFPDVGTITAFTCVGIEGDPEKQIQGWTYQDNGTKKQKVFIVNS